MMKIKAWNHKISETTKERWGIQIRIIILRRFFFLTRQI